MTFFAHSCYCMNQEPSRRQPMGRNGRIWSGDRDMENVSSVIYMDNDLGRTFHCLKQGKDLVLVNNLFLNVIYCVCTLY